MVTPELADSPAATPAGPERLRERARVERSPAWALAAVAALSVVGIVLRLLVAHQSLFGDELSTYWIVATHGLHGTLSLLYSTASIHHAEITPPLTFVLSWFSVQLGHSPELLRLPALVAGALTIPATYLLGTRTVGRRAAVLATALTALSPFMIYYSAEARAYGVMMLLVIVSTLAMLRAVETSAARWWALYAVASCAALYSHYTCGFVLATQFAWLWWAHPQARRAAVVANVGVLVGLLPWLPGLREDLSSPTVTILSALSPWNAHVVPTILAHWAVGYPYADSVGIAQLPGVPALVLLALATLFAVAGLALARGVDRRLPRVDRWLPTVDRRLLLIIALALATPVGEAIVSTFSTHIFGVRNLAASWPALGLAFAVLLVAPASAPRSASASTPPSVPAPARRLRLAAAAVAAAGLAIVSFALGAARLLIARNERPDYQAAADLIARQQRPGDVVIDGTGEISPGPLTPLDVVLPTPITVVRAGAPAERDHPYGFSDPVVSFPAAIDRAVTATRGGRIFIVSTTSAPSSVAQLNQKAAPLRGSLPAPYRLVQDRVYPGIARVEVKVYSRG